MLGSAWVECTVSDSHEIPMILKGIETVIASCLLRYALIHTTHSRSAIQSEPCWQLQLAEGTRTAGFYRHFREKAQCSCKVPLTTEYYLWPTKLAATSLELLGGGHAEVSLFQPYCNHFLKVQVAVTCIFTHLLLASSGQAA